MQQGKFVLGELCSSGMACRVYCHEQVVEDQAGVGREPAGHGGDRVAGFGFAASVAGQLGKFERHCLALY